MTPTYRIGVLDGDGIGPEITPATVAIVQAAADRVAPDMIEWLRLPMGWEAIRQHGVPVPDTVKERLRGCDGWIAGPHDNQSYPAELDGVMAPGGDLRTAFDLYANIRPCRNFPGVDSLVSDVDLVIVRENTEGFYADRNMYLGSGEIMPTSDVALSIGVFTRPAIERIAHAACRLARSRRRRVTIVHKMSALRVSSGLFRDVALEVAAGYPDVEVDEQLVDAMAAHLVRRPQAFDVVLTENMFGDILSDLAGELVGGLGLSPSVNSGDQHAMAQAAHGSAPDIAGKGVANPVGLVLSAAMMLRVVAGRHGDARLAEAADTVEAAVSSTLASGARTADLGGSHGTEQFTEAVVAACATP